MVLGLALSNQRYAHGKRKQNSKTLVPPQSRSARTVDGVRISGEESHVQHLVRHAINGTTSL